MLDQELDLVDNAIATRDDKGTQGLRRLVVLRRSSGGSLVRLGRAGGRRSSVGIARLLLRDRSVSVCIVGKRHDLRGRGRGGSEGGGGRRVLQERCRWSTLEIPR